VSRFSRPQDNPSLHTASYRRLPRIHFKPAMKRPIVFSVALFIGSVCATSLSFAQYPQDSGRATVVQRSEGEALARGYAEAFDLISNKPVFITFERNGQNRRVIAGIRDIKAAGAVVVITTERGTTVAIPAADVISITDERPAGL
jgi:hypothetical protein